MKSKQLGILALMAFAVPYVFFLSANLSQNLYQDETLTYWIVRGDFWSAISLSWKYHGQSPLYYGLLWIWKGIFGESEAALRLMSVGFQVATGYLLFRIGSLLGGFLVGAIAASLWFVNIDCLISTISVRPYGLAVFAVALCYYAFFLWANNSSSFFRQICYALSIALVVYSHYYFGFAVLPQICILFVKPGTTKAALKAFSLAALICLPCVPQLLSIAARSSSLSYAPSGTFLDWLQICFANPAFVVLLLSVFGWRVARLRQISKEEELDEHYWSLSFEAITLVCLLAWIFLVPTLFYVASNFISAFMMKSKYVLWSQLGMCLLAALFFQFAHTRTRLMRWSLFVFFFILLANLKVFTPSWEQPELAFRAADKLSQGKKVPVFAYTAFIESRDLSWLEDPEKRSYLLAPFSYYKTSFTPIALPIYSVGSPYAEYYQSVFAKALENAPEALVIIYNVLWAGEGTAEEVLRSHFLPWGYSLDLVDNFGGIVLARLRRQTPQVLSLLKAD